MKFDSALTSIVCQLQGTLYDFWYDLATARWIGWLETSPPFHFDERLSYSEVIVPTLDSVRYTRVLDNLIRNDKHVLLTGATGTGKTVNAQAYLSRLGEQWMAISMIFSAATSANQTEDFLFSKMEKRRQRVYGPPLGKKFVVFIDDVNMPRREVFFAQPPIELLRQWLDYGGWFNRKGLQWQDIVDLAFVTAMGPPGGGRNPVTARFIRHFNQLAHTEMSSESVYLIFATIMKHSLLQQHFPADVQQLTHATVQATIELYNTLARSLLPTPSKSHYTFNLRDLSAVFQGVLSASPKRVSTASSWMRLWIHENRRVFRDRLVDNDDRAKLDALVNRMLNAHFKATPEEILAGELGANPGQAEASPLLFGDWHDIEHKEKDDRERVYQEITSLPAAAAVLEDYLQEYNEENAPAMKLVMFRDAVEHLSRIARILRQPRGNALLLGVGGSGRQSLTKLATFLCNYQLFQIELHKHYGLHEWHEDMKKMLLNAGLKADEPPTVFLIGDTQLVNETFLEDINNILNCGEIPNLFNNEEMDSIVQTCKIECQQKNIPATKLNAYAQFIHRIRQNLHIVVAMSPMGTAFRTRLRMFPALVNCCTIDWFADWPSEALRSVAMSALVQEEDLKLEPDGGPAGGAGTKAVVEMFNYMHQSVIGSSKDYLLELRRYNYVTPTSYLELINVFKFLLFEKRLEVGGLRSKLQTGLDTLANAAETINKLQQDLREKQPKLVLKQKEVADMMTAIIVDKESATSAKEIVEKQEAEAALKEAECKEINDEAQADLDRALPLLKEALSGVDELNRNDIEEVRNFKKPPLGVTLTMEVAIIMLKGKPFDIKVIMKGDPNNLGKSIPQYWETAQKYLLRRPQEMLTALKQYDKDQIGDKVIAKLKTYITRDEFSVKKIETASKACRAICLWAHAMYNYNEMSKLVEPKRVRLRASQAELAKVTAALGETKQRLAAVQERLRALTEEHEKAVAQQEALQKEVDQCQVKLERANKLIGGLGGEKERWKGSIVACVESRLVFGS